MSNSTRSRTRLRWTLFAAVGAMSTGYIAAITISTLAARAITGSELLVGLPAAIGVVSTAVGTSVLGSIVIRSGRRRSLIQGTVVAVLGAAIAAGSVAAGSFAGLLLGMSALGFGNAASHLSRYTAAELVDPARRGTAVSLVVWAGTIGAVAGPRLLDPAGSAAESLGSIGYAGGFLVAIVAMTVACAILLGALVPDPSSLAIVDDERFSDEDGAKPAGLRVAFGSTEVQVAVVAMVVGHFVMVLIMTGTPIHIENHGHDLGSVGDVISAHTLGMFAFAPLVGRMVDRIGSRPTIWAGAALLAVSGVGAAMAPVDAMTILTVALFLLGLGWNLGFVAGSALLSIAVEPAIRPVVQGRVDSMVMAASAAASAVSGPLLAGPGYAPLGVLGTAMVGCIVVVLVRRRVPATAAA